MSPASKSLTAAAKLRSARQVVQRGDLSDPALHDACQTVLDHSHDITEAIRAADLMREIEARGNE